MATKLINLIALATLAILATSFGPSSVNALSVESPHFVRHNARHDLIAKRQTTKSTSRRRCKARPSSSLVSSSKVVSTSPVALSSHAVSISAIKTTSQAPVQAPKTTSSTPKPTPTPPSTGGGSTGSGGGAKVGIAWANSDENNIANFITNKVSAVYTWSPWKPQILSKFPNVEFVPMFWGPKQSGDFTRLVKAGYAHSVLGFNEPNQSGQANIDPGYGASLWKQYIQPLKSQGYRLISPAPTNAPSGLTWLKSFIAACDGCTIDAIALHWYGTKTQDFIDHCTEYHNAFGREIWVTEFACQNFGGGAQCTNDEIVNFINSVTGWMDGTPWIGKYFAFGVLHNMGNVNWANQLMGSDGKPTALGWNYLT